MPSLWKATCMQTVNYTVNRAETRADAMAIVARSLERWEELLRFNVARRGGMKQLFLFPEFNLQGFPLWESAEEWIAKACFRIPGSPEIERLQRIASDLGVYIGANAYEAPDEWPGRYFNCSFLIDPSGDVILKYRRVSTAEAASPHDILDAYLDKHGIEGLWPVARTELGNIAMMPCGEILWPETARCLMMRGAEVILHPTSDQGHTDQMAWESAKRVRAAENMVYFVSSNSGGIVGAPIAEASNAGNSKIVDFQGQLMSQNLTAGESDRVSAIIDIDALRRARVSPSGPYGVNRLARLRIEAYRPVYAEASFYPVNFFADAPMESKRQLAEALRSAIGKKIADGTFTEPSDGAALPGGATWGS